MNNYKIMSINSLSVEDYNKYFTLCSTQKKEIISNYFNYQDRYRSVLGEKLIKELISNIALISEEKVNISYNEFGKPYTTDCDMFFNISHSGEFVILVYSKKEVGIDIEKMIDINYDIVIKEFATDCELEQYNKSLNSKKFFYQLWTLKEAYFKCVGTGITNIKEIEFMIDNKKNKIFCNKQGYEFESSLYSSDYIISYCKKVS